MNFRSLDAEQIKNKLLCLLFWEDRKFSRPIEYISEKVLLSKAYDKYLKDPKFCMKVNTAVSFFMNDDKMDDDTDDLLKKQVLLKEQGLE